VPGSTLFTLLDDLAILLDDVMVMTKLAGKKTVGVLGDDLALNAEQQASFLAQKVGAGLLRFAPYLMKGLSIAGTLAMFLVGGGILTHGIPGLEAWLANVASSTLAVPAIGSALHLVAPSAFNAVIGILTGALLLTLRGVAKRIRAQ
jgi:uncharacterized protein